MSESLDTSTPHGRFVLTLFGGLAQMERELIGERTRSALAFKRENRQPTSHPPLGFRPNGSRKHRMLPIPEELEIVRQILGLWRTGLSRRAIAAKLNEDGVPTKHGARWYHTSVGKVDATGGTGTWNVSANPRGSVDTRGFGDGRVRVSGGWTRPLGRVHVGHLGLGLYVRTGV